MAWISERYKFLFVMSPRTGCTSIAYGIIAPHLQACRVPWKDILDEKGKTLVDSKHSTLPDLLRYGLLAEDKVGTLFKFCAVRNPFDSLVSLYMKNRTTYAELVDDEKSFLHRKPQALADVRRASDLDFSEWVKERFTRRPTLDRSRRAEQGPARPQHMYERYLEGMDHVMRFERLRDDLDEVLQKLGAPTGIEMPNINPTPREKDYRSYYTDDARRIVEHVFRPDLERFGYRF